MIPEGRGALRFHDSHPETPWLGLLLPLASCLFGASPARPGLPAPTTPSSPQRAFPPHPHLAAICARPVPCRQTEGASVHSGAPSPSKP